MKLHVYLILLVLITAVTIGLESLAYAFMAMGDAIFINIALTLAEVFIMSNLEKKLN